MVGACMCARMTDWADLWSSKVDKRVLIVEDLRERWFGELDNTIITNYNMVWPADLKVGDFSHMYTCRR